MKLEKMSLENLKKLSRREMRSVMAGSGSGGTCKTACKSCTYNSECCSTVCASDQPGCGGGKKCLK